jgi:uncharacterized phage infection (PIP) family protein YhgE
MILVCIVLTVTNVAAFWAWRLAEVSLINEQSKSSMLSLGHSAIKRERDELQARINNAMERCTNLENRWKEAATQNAKYAETENRHMSELTQLRNINMNLQNEIDGLNVDKLHLKSELEKFRQQQQKRREQKAASMRRLRAKKKEAKR